VRRASAAVEHGLARAFDRAAPAHLGGYLVGGHSRRRQADRSRQKATIEQQRERGIVDVERGARGRFVHVRLFGG
jgi:hypothetical protein